MVPFYVWNRWLTMNTWLHMASHILLSLYLLIFCPYPTSFFLLSVFIFNGCLTILWVLFPLPLGVFPLMFSTFQVHFEPHPQKKYNAVRATPTKQYKSVHVTCINHVVTVLSSTEQLLYYFLWRKNDWE